jgi:hypothetical protein
LAQPYARRVFCWSDFNVSGNSVATHNLVVAPLSSGQTVDQWKTSNTSTSGTSSDIDGPANTAAQIAAGAASHPCADFCNSAVIGGFSDWYMPAKNELEVCYFNLKPTNNIKQHIFRHKPQRCSCKSI